MSCCDCIASWTWITLGQTGVLLRGHSKMSHKWNKAWKRDQIKFNVPLCVCVCACGRGRGIERAKDGGCKWRPLAVSGSVESCFVNCIK